MRIIHEFQNRGITSILVATQIGAAYETEKNKGIAHFIEHCVFKGTKNRSRKEILTEIEKVGGTLNAFTSEQFTGFTAKIRNRYVEKAVDLLLDLVCNATFPKEEIEKEKRVVIEEIKRKHDLPDHYIYDKIKELLYRKPFGMSILGEEKIIKRISREEIKKFYSMYRKNLIVCVVGKSSKERVEEIIKNKVGGTSLRSLGPKIKIEKTKGIGTKKEQKKDLMQSHVGIGFYLPSLRQTKKVLFRRYASWIFDTILARGMSSKLFEELREKNPLVYSYYGSLAQERDYGYYVIYAGTSPEKLKKTRETIKKCIKEMKTLTQKELEEGKEKFIGEIEIYKEDSMNVAHSLVLEEMAGNAEEFHNYEERIKEVRLKDVRKIVPRKIFEFLLVPK